MKFLILRLMGYTWFFYFFGHSLAPLLGSYIPLNLFFPAKYLNALPPFNLLYFLLGFFAYLCFYQYGKSTKVTVSPINPLSGVTKLKYGEYDAWARSMIQFTNSRRSPKYFLSENINYSDKLSVMFALVQAKIYSATSFLSPLLWIMSLFTNFGINHHLPPEVVIQKSAIAFFYFMTACFGGYATGLQVKYRKAKSPRYRY